MSANADPYALPPEQRGNRRQRLLLAGELVTRAGPGRVHLLDLSADGAQLDADVPPASGEAVRLRRGAIDAPGKVVWVDGNRFGIAFDSPIAPELIDRKLDA